MISKKRYLRIALATALTVAFGAGSAIAADVDGARVQNADKELEKGNWLTYHGSYKSWHYSPLDQINTKTVGKLTEAWSHTASRANRGLQGFPLAIDGVLYYSSPYNQVYALDGATGQVLWALSFVPTGNHHEAIGRAISFLVGTQQESGAWTMTARYHPDGDITKPRYMVPITYFGSAWATLGLVRFVPAPPDTPARRQRAFGHDHAIELVHRILRRIDERKGAGNALAVDR